MSESQKGILYAFILKLSKTYPNIVTLLKLTASALPSCLQAVFAFLIVNSLCIQIVPQTLLMNISSLPNGGS